MKKAWGGIIFCAVACSAFVALIVFINSPVVVVVVKDAGRIINVREFCDDSRIVYEQNGVRKPFEVGRDCYRAVKFAWCKHLKPNRDCSVDEVAISHQYSFPTYQNYWNGGQEAWREYIGRLWPYPDYEPRLQIGDRVNVGYLENKWFGNRVLFSGVRVAKHKD